MTEITSLIDYLYSEVGGTSWHVSHGQPLFEREKNTKPQARFTRNLLPECAARKNPL